ncbi:hypothetical protein TL18_06535 [Methanobrevibacter sp. YE315]|nr:hypothetical protein TL18_06535 [Methanobrevibacter sp. YE315]
MVLEISISMIHISLQILRKKMEVRFMLKVVIIQVYLTHGYTAVPLKRILLEKKVGRFIKMFIFTFTTQLSSPILLKIMAEL